MVKEGSGVGRSQDLSLRAPRNGPIEHVASTLRGERCTMAVHLRRVHLRRYTRTYIRRRRGVQSGVGRPIEDRNAYETVLWWDAQVPDRLPRYRRQAA
ncbi:hypothetical protein GCM10010377_57920 [Streptomyces viridiviolaceus]|nr:hypothetical protein GCM10010377_57920 [Streptomyces viridiviolaceus]